MTSQKAIARSWASILREAGEPPVRLVAPAEFRERTGYGLNAYVGRASPQDGLIVVKKNRPLADIKNTLWHELLHILFPSRPHWWIECAAAILSRTGQTGRYSRKYGHTPADLPPRAKLVRMCRRSSERLAQSNRAY